jgi:hypothetical protein
LAHVVEADVGGLLEQVEANQRDPQVGFGGVEVRHRLRERRTRTLDVVQYRIHERSDLDAPLNLL